MAISLTFFFVLRIGQTHGSHWPSSAKNETSGFRCVASSHLRHWWQIVYLSSVCPVWTCWNQTSWTCALIQQGHSHMLMSRPIATTNSICLRCSLTNNFWTSNPKYESWNNSYTKGVLWKGNPQAKEVTNDSIRCTLSKACMANTGPSWAFTVLSSKISFQM